MQRARLQSVLRWALLFACVVAFVGHVCALRPAEAHHHGDAGIRAASCEAVAPAPEQPVLEVAVATSVVALPAPATDSILPIRELPALHRPPRFLLYASLLI
jgi:hypothetical protein